MTQISVSIDKISDDLLVYIIRHSKEFTWNFLAIKIMLTRLNLKIAMCQNEDEALHGCCNELRSLLKNSINIPNSQADLKQILSIKL